MEDTTFRADPDGMHYLLNEFFQISPTVDDSADFHGVTDHHVEDGVVSDRDSVIRILAISTGKILLKGFGTRQSVINGLFDFIHKVFCRNGIL